MTELSLPADAASAAAPQPLSRSIAIGSLLYLICNLPVVLGVCLGFYALRPGEAVPYGSESLLLRFCAWDGGQFMDILNRGYRFDPEQISNVALFPGYPVLAAGVRNITGWSAAASLLLVAQLSLCGGLIIWHRYLTIRFADRPEITYAALAAVVFYPPSFFFRMAYSEPLFLLLTAAVLLSLQRSRHPAITAFLIGTAIFVRLVGIALIPPFLLSILLNDRPAFTKLKTLAGCLPLCFWGLFAYMAFLWDRFGDPFVFSAAQDNFYLRPPVSTLQHWYRLLTLEPLWANYLPDSDAYWRRQDPKLPAVLSLQFANPIWFLLIVTATIGGWARRILTDVEFLLSAGLLSLAYVGRAEEFCMGSQARYSLSVLPAFIVFGSLLVKAPAPLRWIVATGSVALLTSYSALFAAWYFFL